MNSHEHDHNPEPSATAHNTDDSASTHNITTLSASTGAESLSTNPDKVPTSDSDNKILSLNLANKEIGAIPLLRQKTILEILNKQGFVKISALAKSFAVSPLTIRRDVHKMEEDGLVVQVRGGVKSVKRLQDEPSHQEKASLFAAEKERIAAAASMLIKENSCIYLDAGTTSLALCKHLNNRNDLTIISNDIEVIHTLLSASQCHNNLIMIGGQIRNQNFSSVGYAAANMISGYAIDIAFLSASSFDRRGITTPDPEKVPVKQAASAAANKRVLICDSSKYAQQANYVAVPLKQIDTIITDDELSEAGKDLINEAGIELIIV